MPRMKMPFERLTELVSALGPDDGLTLGALGERWGETPQRIGDAIDAVRVLNGERTCIP
jgi:hypothetical protein